MPSPDQSRPRDNVPRLLCQIAPSLTRPRRDQPSPSTSAPDLAAPAVLGLAMTRRAAPFPVCPSHTCRSSPFPDSPGRDRTFRTTSCLPCHALPNPTRLRLDWPLVDRAVAAAPCRASPGHTPSCLSGQAIPHHGSPFRFLLRLSCCARPCRDRTGHVRPSLATPAAPYQESHRSARTHRARPRLR